MLLLIRKKISPLLIHGSGVLFFVLTFFINEVSAYTNPLGFEKKLSGEIFYNFPNVIGSIFLYEEWVSGDVVLECGAIVRDQQLKYSGYLNELFWLRENDNLTVRLDKGLIDSFILYPTHQPLRSFRRSYSMDADSEEVVFIEELYLGARFSVFAWRSVVERGTQTENINQRVYQRTKVEPQSFYIVKNHESGKSYRFSRMNRRNIYRALDYEKATIREIIRHSNVSLASGESELKRLIKLLNENL